MAVLGLSLGGAALGSAIFGTSAAIQGGFILGQFAAKALGLGVEKNRPDGTPEVTEFRITNSAYGDFLPTVDGTFRVPGKIFWFGEIRAVESQETVSAKGAGGGKATYTKTEYFGTFGVSFADALDLLPGGYDKILKLRMGVDQEVIFDLTQDIGPMFGDRLRRAGISVADYTSNPSGVNAFLLLTAKTGGGGIRVYTGEEGQQPDPAIQAFEGVENTTAHIGTCTIVFEDFPLNGPVLEPVSAVVTTGTTPKYPYERVEPAVLENSWKAWYGADDRTLYIPDSAGNWNVIDLLGRTLLRSLSVGSQFDLISLDAQNFWWGWRDETADDATLFLWDADTGAQVAASVTKAWQDPVVVTQIVPLSGGLGGAIGFGSYGRMAQLRRNPFDDTIEVIRSQNDTPAFQLDPAVASWLIGGASAWTFDGAGDFWIGHGSTTGSWTIRCSGIDGTPLEYFNIGAGLITYEPTSDALIIQSGSNLVKFDLETRTVVDTLAGSLDTGGHNAAAFRRGPIAGKLYLQESFTGNGGVFDVAATPMVRLGNFQPNVWLGTANNWEGPVYDPVNHAILVTQTSGSTPFDYAWLFLDRYDPAPWTLKDTVERRSASVGLDLATDVDVATLTDAFPGGVFPQRDQVRQYLEPTQPIYQYDILEEFRIDGYKIRGKKRGSASVADIPIDDLEARRPGARIEEQPTITREDVRTKPRLLELRYADPSIDYQPGLQPEQRELEVVANQEQRVIDARNYALTDDQAARAAESFLFSLYLQQNGFAFTTSLKWLKLSAGDVVRILGETLIFTVLIRQVRRGLDGVRAYEAVAEDASVYSSNATGGAAEGVPISSVAILAPTTFATLDIPLLPGELDDLRLFWAGGPTSDSGQWPGATLFRSTDGLDFAAFERIEQAAPIGFILEALPDADPSVLDRTNTLKVRLLSGGPLSSVTEAQLLADLTLNGYAIKSGSGWELGNYVDATLQADGSWHLTTLVRGSFNTENYTGGHTIGDPIIFLSIGALLARKVITVSELGVERYYRAVTAGAPLRDAVTKMHTAVGRSKLPYSPHLLDWTLSGGDYTVNALRRGRIFNLPVTFGSVPLGEGVKDFEADLFDDGGAVALTITQTASANGSKITITGDRFATLVKAADLAGITIPFTLKLYQIGGADGATRGEPTTVIVG